MWTRPETYEDAVAELAQWILPRDVAVLGSAGPQITPEAHVILGHIAGLNMAWDGEGFAVWYDWAAHEALVTFHLTRHAESAE